MSNITLSSDQWGGFVVYNKNDYSQFWVVNASDNYTVDIPSGTPLRVVSQGDCYPNTYTLNGAAVTYALNAHFHDFTISGTTTLSLTSYQYYQITANITVVNPENGDVRPLIVSGIKKGVLVYYLAFSPKLGYTGGAYPSVSVNGTTIWSAGYVQTSQGQIAVYNSSITPTNSTHSYRLLKFTPTFDCTVNIVVTFNPTPTITPINKKTTLYNGLKNSIVLTRENDKLVRRKVMVVKDGALVNESASTVISAPEAFSNLNVDFTTFLLPYTYGATSGIEQYLGKAAQFFIGDPITSSGNTFIYGYKQDVNGYSYRNWDFDNSRIYTIILFKRNGCYFTYCEDSLCNFIGNTRAPLLNGSIEEPESLQYCLPYNPLLGNIMMIEGIQSKRVSNTTDTNMMNIHLVNNTDINIVFYNYGGYYYYSGKYTWNGSFDGCSYESNRVRYTRIAVVKKSGTGTGKFIDSY